MSLNPIITSQKIFERYSDYITTSLRLKDGKLSNQIVKELKKQEKFAKGPMIEATPPFVFGKTLRELVQRGDLCDEFENFKTEELPLDRNLYKHQEETIVNVSGNKRNAVVATGTGSGKTESFMIPIINELLKEKVANRLGPGVRALLLYPMNALANDQMKRLRDLLEHEASITFGIYTGETEKTYDSALGKFQRMHHRLPLKNELISRDQMKETPPNILLTNYAMLEYLMLRPEDNVFFQGAYAKFWRFIVIDEGHTYTGAKGIEMSMLIARLKSILGMKPGELTCMLTSASLGKGKEDFPKVAEFASKLFSEHFSPEDVIEATKRSHSLQPSWGEPGKEAYEQLLAAIDKDFELPEVLTILQDADFPKEEIQELTRTYEAVSPILFHLLSGDRRVIKTMGRLEQGPVALEELSGIILSKKEDVRATASLIDLCNRIRKHEKDNPLIPARYHYIVKALEGGYIAFSKEPQVFLKRMNRAKIGNADYKAFEMGACTKCNSLYIVGEIEQGLFEPFQYLKESKQRYSDEDQKLEYFAVIDKDMENIIENEDESSENHRIKIPSFSRYKLCVYCGGIDLEGINTICACESPRFIPLLKVNNKNEKVHKCGVCQGLNPKGNIVRRFFLAEDAVASVLATALYQELPNKKKRIIEEEDDPFGSDDLTEEVNDFIETNKQLLIFSDSRQSAAYFAPYLNRSYQDLLSKNAMIKTLRKNIDTALEHQWTVGDYHNRIFRYIQEQEIFTESIEELKTEVWRWIIREFIIDTGMNSLSKMGLVHFKPNFANLPNFQKVRSAPFLKAFNFSDLEIESLYTYFLDQFRSAGAVEFPELISPLDEYFSPQNKQGGFWERKPEGEINIPWNYNIKSWITTGKGRSNSRQDYIEKIFKKIGHTANNEELQSFLENVFKTITHSKSPLKAYLYTEHIKNVGKIYKINPNLYQVLPGVEDYQEAPTHYRCDTCYKTTTINVKGVCPTYRCQGTLYEINLLELLEKNHYRKIYQQLKPEKMKTSEHTAQLKTEYAAEVQSRFINGDINVLSCSTTFELGVDVGELETVFMKNMPPTPANYAQRAGRAGRRINATAYALTYARLASHDFNSFKDPSKMISGIVKPPYFEVANDKIALRHVYACAFAMFWRQNTDYFKTVKDFFMQEPSGPDVFREYLISKPQELQDMIRSILPLSLQERLDIENWKWVRDLYGTDGVMTKVTLEINQDLTRLVEAREVAKENNEFYKAGSLNRVINTIQKRPLINYLSQKNLLPKYGFPVDVVAMEINGHTDEAKSIDLSRDLQIAISEYAPDSEVVANGKLWTSRYVKKIADREWLKYDYMKCRCGFFKKTLQVEEQDIRVCPICGESKIQQGTFLMPEFGFISEDKPKEPSQRKPEKTYSGRKHFSGQGSNIVEKEIEVQDNKVYINAQTHGQLTVINDGKGRGFYICKQCGYGTLQKKLGQHKNATGYNCKGHFERIALGYDFETDLIEIDLSEVCKGHKEGNGYWLSIMYALIEGISNALEVDRSDIDGTLYFKASSTPSIILFDTVPGGAGHVKRLMNETAFFDSVKEGLKVLEQCTCGGEAKDTSCYGCLRNYYNQYCHDDMERRYGIKGLKEILAK